MPVPPKRTGGGSLMKLDANVEADVSSLSSFFQSARKDRARKRAVAVPQGKRLAAAVRSEVGSMPGNKPCSPGSSPDAHTLVIDDDVESGSPTDARLQDASRALSKMRVTSPPTSTSPPPAADEESDAGLGATAWTVPSPPVDEVAPSPAPSSGRRTRTSSARTSSARRRSSSSSMHAPAGLPMQDSAGADAVADSDAADLDASWLILRAVRSCDDDDSLPTASWAPLRQAMVELARLQAEWSQQQPPPQPPSPPPSRQAPSGRRVRFHCVDGSHLIPPMWGRDPPLGSGGLANAASLDPLYSIVRLQLEWLESCGSKGDARRKFRARGSGAGSLPSSPPSPPSRAGQRAIEALRSGLHSALNEASAAASAAALAAKKKRDTSTPVREALARRASAVARARAEAAYLDVQLGELAGSGVPVLGAKFSELLSSSIRQQLRRMLPRARSAALLRDLPRGRGVGWLGKCESAARILSNALYEMHNLKPLLTEPTLVSLLGASERDARDVLEQLPPETIEELLTLSEAHAALRHMICTHPDTLPTPQEGEAGWDVLSRLLGMAHATRGVAGGAASARSVAAEDCGGLDHFLPLMRLQQYRRSLLSPSEGWGVLSLVHYLEWASPQQPVHRRTRGGAGGVERGASPLEMGAASCR